LKEESNDNNAADNQGDHNNDEISINNDSSLEDKGDNNEENNTKDSDRDQNLCHSCHMTKGKTSRFDNYNLCLIARWVAQGGLRQAII
jgi:hypothetical protein